MDRRARLGLVAAIALAGLGLLLVAVAGTARWVTAVPADPDLPGAARVALTGSTLVPAAIPLALVGVAGVIAAAAAGNLGRGALRLGAACLVVAAGIGVVGLTASVLTSPADAVRASEPARQAAATVAADESPVGWLAITGGVLLAVAGGVALRYRRGWPGLAARYDRTAEQGPRSAESRPAASTWDAIERGEDPTREA